MAATLCMKLLPKQGWLPFTQSVRHGSKAVTRRRKPIHFVKQKLLAVTRYIPPPPGPPPDAYPSTVQRVRKENPMMPFMKKEVEKVFQESRMIAVVQNNNSNVEDMLQLRHRLHRHNIKAKFYQNQVVRSFLQDTIYCNMAPLFIGPTVLFVSKEPKVKQLLATLRASPQMTLLGACVDNTLLTVQGLMSYAQLPTMTMVQGELVSGLTMLTSNTAHMLQRHPARLSALLQQYVKQQSEEGGGEEAT